MNNSFSGSPDQGVSITHSTLTLKERVLSACSTWRQPARTTSICPDQETPNPKLNPQASTLTRVSYPVQYLEAAGADDEYETDGDGDDGALTATERARASLARRSVQVRRVCQGFCAFAKQGLPQVHDAVVRCASPAWRAVSRPLIGVQGPSTPDDKRLAFVHYWCMERSLSCTEGSCG